MERRTNWSERDRRRKNGTLLHVGMMATALVRLLALLASKAHTVQFVRHQEISAASWSPPHRRRTAVRIGPPLPKPLPLMLNAIRLERIHQG